MIIWDDHAARFSAETHMRSHSFSPLSFRHKTEIRCDIDLERERGEKCALIYMSPARAANMGFLERSCTMKSAEAR
jgi:hypothetical protein